VSQVPAQGWRTVGQPSALSAIERAVRDGRPPQALLLVGPANVGKTTLALDLAAALLCTERDETGRPCHVCAACRRVAHGNHPDLHRLAPTGPGGQVLLPAVRALLAEMALRPMEGRHRIAVIEQADRLNEDAQNALLKLLEEPPEGAVVCLAVDDETAILDTVVSRCRRLRLGPTSPDVIATLLVERGLADASRASLLARVAAGRPGVAVAFAERPEGLLVEARLVRQLLDLLAAPPAARLVAAPGLLAEAAELVEDSGGARAPGSARQEDEAQLRDGEGNDGETPRDDGGGTPRDDQAERGRRSARMAPAERRRAVRRLLELWRETGRELAVVAFGGAAESHRVDLLEDFTAAAATLVPSELTGFLARLDGLALAIDGYANPELVLDTLLLAWPAGRRAA
jgi:DNA polymerase III subunit delta'